MFTGLIKDIGKIVNISSNAEGMLLEIRSNKLISDIEIDDSVSINGACQTAIKILEDSFIVQAVHTTLKKTTLGNLRKDDEVNLELAMRLSDRLGGHIVQGHVNDVGTIINFKNLGQNYLVTLKVSNEQMKYIVKEGSVTIDGISLTVSNIFKEDCSFQVSVIPHTWNNTVLRNRKVGSRVNIEVDILGKYIENLLSHAPKNTNNSQLTQSWLKDNGF